MKRIIAVALLVTVNVAHAGDFRDYLVAQQAARCVAANPGPYRVACRKQAEKDVDAMLARAEADAKKKAKKP